MIKRLKYLLMMMLMLTAFHVAGQYTVDKVCVGTERYYRVSGEPNSTYTWQLTDPAGAILPQLSDRDTIGIIWNMVPGIYRLSVIQHGENNCDADIELGTVEVFAQPTAFAGNNTTFCALNPVTLSSAQAQDYASLAWTTSGDGTFDNDTILHPVYTPGVNDIIAGNVVLSLTATGKGNAGTCQPAVSAVHISLSLVLSAAISTAVPCFGIPGGTVTLTASGGTEPYTYTLGGNSNNSGYFTDLAPGTYTYTISDANNCDTQGEVSVGNTTAMTASIVSSQASCFGVANGSIKVISASGGSGHYAYSTDNTNWQSSSLFTGLTAGTYNVYMHDSVAQSCVVMLGTVNITEPAALLAVSQHTNLSLPGANDGTITIANPSGGSGTYEYSIGEVNWQTSAFFGNLAAGTYKVYMRDASAPDCAALVGIEIILDGLSVSIVTWSVSCYGYNDGQALAITVGGTEPYAYIWNDAAAQTGSTATGLAAGIYTVMVTDAMGNTASATDTVTQPQMVIPAFGTIGPLCINSIPPPLPLVSLDSITGRWDPPAINTSLIGISSYTFTPDAGQCAVNATVEIMITSEIIPAFAAIGPLCLDSEPPALPGTSLNGITGTWAPAIISTNQTGTFIYTFTPDTAQCATPVTMAIQVSNQIVPQFAGIGPLCQNSISPPLPSTSLNGITGNWNPATINTSDTGTFIYTFLPDPGQCSDSATVAIQVNVQLIPLFAGIGPLCQNSTPPALPETSLNGISGYWTPGTINTAVAGTTTCLFTPDALTCALGFTLEITVTPEMIPDFPAIGPLCQNSQPPVLPGTSSNGITGTWTPPAINTSVTGTMSYTFAPDTGQCAIPITSEITVAAEIMPVFAAIGPLCMNTQPPALPGTSVNGISGKWVPAVINTGIPGTIIYTFTPDAGQCGIVISLAVQVTDQLVPHFEDIGPLCQNSVPHALPAISSEGITGTWNPASISTGDFGSTNYIFTPVNGQCAVTTSLTIEIKGPVISSILTISSTNGLPNGYARIKVQDSLSSSPLTYSLDETHWQNSAEFRGLIAGTYVGWVRDALGCITFRQFVIPNTITGEVGILAGDVLSCISVPIQIPVMAYDFTNIAAFTIQLTYDSTVVAFTGLSQISSLLSDGVLSTSSVSPGVIQFSFVANDSITMYNDGLLFDLNFIGLVSGHTNLEWNWLRCVIYSAAGYELPAIYTMGTIEIRPAPQIFTDGGGTYCEGADAKLSAGSLTGQKLSYNWTSPGGSTYLGQEWDLGKVDTTFTGVYQVTASDSTACSKSEDIAVQVYTNPVIQISDHDTLCSEQEITLNAGPGFAAYLWQDGSTAPQLVAAEEGWYKVIVTDIHGCEGGDSVLLRPCELLLWMPNAFSPNGDDLNDVFGPKYNVDVDIDFHMEIYNKWGERIFVTDDIRKGWDGTFKGKLCPSDMYTWTIRFKAPYTYYFLQKSPQSGNVLLLK